MCSKNALSVGLLLTLLSLGCGLDRVSSLHEDFFVEQKLFELGRVYTGHGREVVIPVESRSRYALSLSAGGQTLQVPAGGITELKVWVERTAPGTLEERILNSGEQQSLEIVITGDAALVPDCAARNSCVRAQFDFQSGACVEVNLPEDTACGGASSCVSNGHCEAGECRGEAVSCDDGNACTDDACSVGEGCVHLDSSSRCELGDSTANCAAGYCDPQSGCQTAQVQDGTACGPANCAVAQVCISGVCEQRAVPEGASCGGNSPCQSKGQCTQGSCVQPSPTALTAAWTYSPPGNAQVRSALGIDDQGALVFVECVGGGGCELVSLTASSAQRYRTLMPGVTSVRTFALARGRVFISTEDGVLLIHHAATGARIATVNTLSLVQADLLPMSGGASSTHAEVTNLAADGAGRIFLIVRVHSTSGDTFSNRGSFLLSLDDAAGSLLWKRRAGSFMRLVVNEQGHVFSTEWSATETNVARLVSWDALGVERYAVSGYDAPIAAHAGKLLTQYGMVRSSTGAPLGGSSSGPRGGSEVMLMRNDSVWGLEIQDCFPAEPALNRFETTTGTTSFRTVLDASLYSYAVTSPLLTQDDGVLLTVFSSPTPGVNRNTLMEVDATGAVTMKCELAGAQSPSVSVLAAERYFVIDQEPSTLTDQGYRAVIRAYDVPGRVPAITGWIGPAGGPQLSSRPR